VKAVDKVIGKAKKIAAHLMERAESRPSSSKTVLLSVKGTDKKKAFAEVSAGRPRAAQLSPRTARTGAGRERLLRSGNFTFTGRQPHLRSRGRTPDKGGGQRQDRELTAVDDFGKIITDDRRWQVHGGLTRG